MTQAVARDLLFLLFYPNSPAPALNIYSDVALCSGSAAASAGGMNGGRGRRGSRTPLWPRPLCPPRQAPCGKLTTAHPGLAQAVPGGCWGSSGTVGTSEGGPSEAPHSEQNASPGTFWRGAPHFGQALSVVPQ